VLESETDYKSLVLEYGQKYRFPVNFRSTEEIDQTTQKTVFSIALEINNENYATGRGNSKKEAEQDAALQAWTKIRSMS